MFGFPAGEALGKLAAALLRRASGAKRQRSRGRGGGDSFAAIFDSGQPGTVERERCAFYIKGKVALNIRAGGFKTGEPNLGDNLSRGDARGQRVQWPTSRGASHWALQQAGEEVAVGTLQPKWSLASERASNSYSLNRPLGGAATLSEVGHGSEWWRPRCLAVDCEGRDLPDEGEFLG